MSLDLDRSAWRRVKFGDVVRNVNESVRDLSEAGIERVIGLDHLDPGELRITRWGDASEETTFTRRVKPGQVLFGKRRAYQRKTAYADFAAVCSGDILVFESADPNTLEPQLLPFLAMTDSFYERALQTSAGSLSPRTKWADLAKFEFDLPPLDQQRRIADLLWSMETHLRALYSLEDAASTALNQVAEREVWERGFSEVALEVLLESCEYGTSERCNAEPGLGTPVLRIPNVVSGTLSLDDLKFAGREAPASDDAAVAEGDILIVRTNGNPNYVGVGALVPPLEETVLFASYLLRLRVHQDTLLPEFLLLGWSSKAFRTRLSPYIRSSAGNYNLSSSSIKNVSFPCPPRPVQKQIVETLQGAKKRLASISDERREVSVLRQAALGTMFGVGGAS